MKSIDEDTNKLTRRLKIIGAIVLLNVLLPIAMIGAIGSLHGPSGIDWKFSGYKLKLKSFW